MGIVGVIILATALFIAAVNLVLAYICLILASPVQRIASRTPARAKIPADWNRIMQETTIEKKRRTK